jgi:hypothetical protein
VACSFEPAKDVKHAAIFDDGRTLRIEATLDPKQESVLVDFLKANLDMFAWKPSDMNGVPREVVEHKLNIKSGSKPVKQRLCCFNDEKCKAISEEIKKLLNSGFIREVFHPEWLSNPVLVKKKNKKWMMCVDYTGLNKAYPKYSFPLPCIDQVVHSTAGCKPSIFSMYTPVPPDSDVHSGPTCDLIHHSVQRLQLQDDALWAQKHGHHVPEMHATCL